MEKLTGLIAAPFTPFAADGSLALDQIPTLAHFYVKNGVSGAFICGTTGEGPSMTMAEKQAMMEAWGAIKTPELKLIAMLGGTSLQEMQELGRFAAARGMDAVAVLCPYYFKPSSVRGLVDFCREVAQVIPETPFYYYHIPSLTGGHFSMQEFLTLADGQIPNLAGIKFTAPNIMDFHACTRFKNGKYDLLWGTDEAMLSALVIGARGMVGSTYNYAAPLYKRIIQAFQANDLARAEQLQYLSVRMVQLLEKYGGAGAGKAFMKIIGIDCGWFRPPVQHPDPVQVETLRSELTDLGFFEFCSRR